MNVRVVAAAFHVLYDSKPFGQNAVSSAGPAVTGRWVACDFLALISEPCHVHPELAHCALSSLGPCPRSCDKVIKSCIHGEGLMMSRDVSVFSHVDVQQSDSLQGFGEIPVPSLRMLDKLLHTSCPFQLCSPSTTRSERAT